jgi:hypothetical protein
MQLLKSVNNTYFKKIFAIFNLFITRIKKKVPNFYKKTKQFGLKTQKFYQKSKALEILTKR